MADTRTQINQRWESKAYKKILVRLRLDTDKDIIDWIESHKEKIGTTNIFRDAMKKYIAEYDED